MSWETLIQVLIIIIAVAVSIDKWIETHWKGKAIYEHQRSIRREGM